MKRYLVVIGIIAVCYLGYVGISLALLPPVADLADRKLSMTVQVKDWQGSFHPFVIGPKNRYWVPGTSIPAEMKWAVILAEDANFYKHEGIDVKAIKNAIKYDLEKKSLARGASTITQQTAKNLFLSREKTLTRKVKEVILAKRMEEELTKGRIVELYLNVVELGPEVWGVEAGSRKYFRKSAARLSVAEAAALAGSLPFPLRSNPGYRPGRMRWRQNMIIRRILGEPVEIPQEAFWRC